MVMAKGLNREQIGSGVLHPERVKWPDSSVIAPSVYVESGKARSTTEAPCSGWESELRTRPVTLAGKAYMQQTKANTRVKSRFMI